MTRPTRTTRTTRLRGIPRAQRLPGPCHVHGPDSAVVADLNAALWLQLAFENF